MTFEQALFNNPALRAVGPLAVRYEDQLLIGQRTRGSGAWATVLLAGAAALGVAAAALILRDNDGLWGGAGLGAGAALLTAASIRLEQRARARHGFVLNFASETLRWHQPRTTQIGFDQVRDLRLAAGSRQASLVLDYEPSPGLLVTATLVEGLPPDSAQALTLHRVLRAAFGLTSGSVISPS